jgi:phosphatidylglycerophosphate synthase
VIDAALRRRLGPSLDRAGAALAVRGARAGWLTGAGWVAGVGACGAAGTRAWGAALSLWLVNRALDGLDGPVARARTGPTDRGAFLDIVADFSIYGGFVVAVGIAEPEARWACLALLLTYYMSGTAFLALSSLLEKRRSELGDERSLRFVGGLAEGAETVLVYVLFCLFPGHARAIAVVFACAVAVTAAQRVWLGAQLLRPSGADKPVNRPSTAFTESTRRGCF